MMEMWMRTDSYKRLSSKYERLEVRSAEEIEAAYHDIIAECFQTKTSQKVNNMNDICMRIAGEYQELLERS